MIRRPPRSTLDRSSAASDVYKRQAQVAAAVVAAAEAQGRGVAAAGDGAAGAVADLGGWLL